MAGIVSQSLTLFVTPVLYLYMERLSLIAQRMFRGAESRPPRAAEDARRTI